MNDAEVLGVRFEADIRELVRALGEADKRITAMERGAERGAKRTKDHFGQLGYAVRQLVGAFSLAGITAGVIKLAENAAKIAKVADVVGLSAERFQELAFAAREAGLNQDQFSGAMQQFAARVAEAKARTGEFYTFLRGANPTLLAQFQATRSTGEAMDVLAEAVRRMDTDQNAALLTSKAMGREATLMAGAMRREGAAGFDVAANAARRYGQVISEDAIKRTKELNDELNKLGTRTGTLATEALGFAAGGINRFIDNVKRAGPIGAAMGFDHWGTSGEAAAKGITLAGVALASWNAEVKDFTLDKPDFRGADELSALAQQLAAARGNAGQQIALDADRALERVKRLHAEGALSEGEYQRARVIVAQTAEAQRADLARQTEATLNDLRRAGLEANGNFYDAIRLEYEADLSEFQLQLDRKLISQAEFEEARSNLNAAAGERIRQRMRQDADDVRAQLSELEGAISGPIDSALGEAFRGNKPDMNEFFIDLVAGINQAIVKMLILKPLMDGLFGGGAGGGAGLIGPMLGMRPARAEGGGVMAGVPYRINERAGRKPEVFIPSTGGRMVPGERASAGGAVNYTFSPVIDARYSDLGVEQRIMSSLAMAEAQRPSPVEAMRAASNRFPTRR